jgi:hypothetical protein
MFERLDQIDFFHLDDCVGMLDVPQVIVEVQSAHGSHRVIATEGCTSPGIAELRRAAREFEDTVRTQRWVGHVVPCALVLNERIYFASASQFEVSASARELLADIAVVLRKFGIPATLVGSRGSGESPKHAIARATAVRDVLAAAGVATSSMRVESSTPITSGSPSVSLTIDVPPCSPGQSWIVLPSSPAPS